MTKLKFVLIAVCLTVGLSLGGVAQAQTPKDVNVVNEPNVSDREPDEPSRVHEGHAGHPEMVSRVYPARFGRR